MGNWYLSVRNVNPLQNMDLNGYTTINFNYVMIDTQLVRRNIHVTKCKRYAQFIPCFSPLLASLLTMLPSLPYPLKGCTFMPNQNYLPVGQNKYLSFYWTNQRECIRISPMHIYDAPCQSLIVIGWTNDNLMILTNQKPCYKASTSQRFNNFKIDKSKKIAATSSVLTFY